jgi:hypothetical protein
MAYGTIKIDTITFTDGGIDKSVAVSGLVQNPTFTGSVTVTGTISGNTVQGQTISGVTITGTTAQFTSGTFTSLTGVTVTGTTADFTSGNFTNISGGTHTITSGVFALGTAASPSISFVSDLNTGIYSPGADQVAISTNGTGRLFVASDGKVGISTASPDNLLHVRAGDVTEAWAANSADAFKIEGSVHGINLTTSTTGFVAFSDANARAQGLIEYLHASDSMQFRTAGSERARIDSSGRLLVGTSSSLSAGNWSDSLIQVRGNSSGSTFEGKLALFTGRTIAAGIGAGESLGRVAFGNGEGGEAAWITAQADAGWSASDYPGRLVFSTTADGASSPTERVRITSAGNVGIGTTSPYSPLTVRGLGNNITLDLNSTTANDYSAIVWNGSTVDVTANSTCEIRGYRVASAAGELGFHTRTAGGISQERARIDSSGRLLVGTSTSVGASGLSTPQVQFSQNGASSESITSLTTWCGTSTGFASQLHFRRSYSDTLGTHTVVVDGARLGTIRFTGSDGTDFKQAATIFAEVDGTPGTNDMPGRLVFSTTADGASSPTERVRITNDGVHAYNQGAPAAVNATATLTVANLKTGIITSTSAAATDMTLPTGTDTEAGFSGIYTNMTFEWSVINTGPSLVRVLAGTAHTIVGSGSVATGTSGRFASRRTAANTFVTYRLS